MSRTKDFLFEALSYATPVLEKRLQLLTNVPLKLDLTNEYLSSQVADLMNGMTDQQRKVLDQYFVSESIDTLKKATQSHSDDEFHINVLKLVAFKGHVDNVCRQNGVDNVIGLEKKVFDTEEQELRDFRNHVQNKISETAAHNIDELVQFWKAKKESLITLNQINTGKPYRNAHCFNGMAGHVFSDITGKLFTVSDQCGQALDNEDRCHWLADLVIWENK